MKAPTKIPGFLDGPVVTQPTVIPGFSEPTPSIYSVAEPKMRDGYGGFTKKSVTLGKSLGDDWNQSDFFLGGKSDGAFYGGSSSFNPTPSPIPVTSSPIGSVGDDFTAFSPNSVGFGGLDYSGYGRSDPFGGFDW